jgi:predicted RNA-binding protein YlqC (UPF0109 family)
MKNEAPTKEQVLFIIRRIIAELTMEPEKTKVTAEQIGYSTVGILIDPNPTDYGRILGGGGSREHLGGMKAICKLISDRCGKNFDLTLKQIPPATGPKQILEFKPVTKWPKDEIQALTEDIFHWIIDPPCKVVISDSKVATNTEIAVFVSEDVPPRTVEWITMRLTPIYKAIGLKNGRLISFNIIQDDSVLRDLIARDRAEAA